VFGAPADTDADGHRDRGVLIAGGYPVVLLSDNDIGARAVAVGPHHRWPPTF
jgi:hypothetical protein